MKVGSKYIPFSSRLMLSTKLGDRIVNPQHITAALAVLYMDDKGGKVHVSKDMLLDAQSRIANYEIHIIDDEVWVQEKHHE